MRDMMMSTGYRTHIIILTIATALFLSLEKVGSVSSAEGLSSSTEDSSLQEDPLLLEINSAERAAKIGLEEIYEIGLENEGDAYANTLGFTSAKEMRRSQLGVPLLLYRVPIDRLKGFRATDSLINLLFNTETMMYPLLVDGQARSMITVGRSSSWKRWRPTGAGYGEFVRLVEKHRTPGADIVILVSDLRLKFLAFRVAEEFEFIPLTEREDFGILPGPPALSARETFVKLSLHATRSNQPLPGRESTKSISSH